MCFCLLLLIYSCYNIYAYLQESDLFYHVGFWDCELGLSGLAESPFTPLPISRALKKNLLTIYNEPKTYDLEWIDPQIGKLRRSLGPRKTEHLAVTHTPHFQIPVLRTSVAKGLLAPSVKSYRHGIIPGHSQSWRDCPVIKGGGGSFVTRFYMGMGAFRAKLSTPQSTTKSFLHISQHGFPSLTVLI